MLASVNYEKAEKRCDLCFGQQEPILDGLEDRAPDNGNQRKNPPPPQHGLGLQPDPQATRKGPAFAVSDRHTPLLAANPFQCPPGPCFGRCGAPGRDRTNFSPGLWPIKNFLWRLRRKSV